ncbi:DUF72 domain-containing protein [Roseomonas chloroacetimidivorans]|uniref:DUF72 domain-containing protein n=1 Tax=Roseomonas chloroacetimidivorans TaxID=1766656 RepID=UPI003C7634F2
MQHAAAFLCRGSHLERHACRFSAVGINSSFCRSHRPATYVRQAESALPSFHFAVAVPRETTHNRRLVSAARPLIHLRDEEAAPGDRPGPLLVQLPSSLGRDEILVGSIAGSSTLSNLRNSTRSKPGPDSGIGSNLEFDSFDKLRSPCLFRLADRTSAACRNRRTIASTQSGFSSARPWPILRAGNAGICSVVRTLRRGTPQGQTRRIAHAYIKARARRPRGHADAGQLRAHSH